jgi:hypothetical protein
VKKFIIERNLPGAGNLTKEELQNIAQTSCKVALELGKGYQWVESFVTGDKIFCVHIAENEEAIREHSKKGNFPCNTIREVEAVFGPMTAYQS